MPAGFLMMLANVAHAVAEAEPPVEQHPIGLAVFALLFVGATFTEKIFGWHGMGEYFVDSVTKNDVNSVAAVTLFVAVLVLIAGFLSDVAYALLDPRVRV